MRSASIIALILAAFVCNPNFLTAGPDSRQESAKQPNPDEIIQKFLEKETEFFEAWKQYAYTQTTVVHVLEVDHVPTKESLMLVAEVVFDDDGNREIRKLEHLGRLKSLKFTPEDEEIIYNLNPFALTLKERPSYNIKYLGEERVDELDCYVFSVDPRDMKTNEAGKYFRGKIWVDNVDFQIVRTLGRAVPEPRDNKFPEFETIRQVIDGKYWFPVWTHADETLRFENGDPQDVRIEETITYEGYKEFRSKTKVRYGNQEISDDKSK